MSNSPETPFVAFLNRHDQEAWWTIVDNLTESVHEVDKDASRIWFHFWPLWLRRVLRESETNERLIGELELKGSFRLEEQVDSSHHFLYGHRFWPQVKGAISELADSEAAVGSLDMTDQIRSIADKVAQQVSVDPSLLLGITAAGFMTLQQVGLEAFRSAPGDIHISEWARKRSPEKVIGRRAKNDSGGVFGFLKGLKRDYTITFHEGHKTGKFKLIEGVELTQASMTDTAEHPYADPRCKPDEGPIPTECRSAACGTCRVGVLGGNDRLSEVNPLEGRRVRKFGYLDSEEPRPLIRLACKAKATGNVTIVVPPWNGVLGNYLEGKRTAVGGASAEPGEEAAVGPRRH